MTTATKKLLIIDDDEAVIDYLHAKLGSQFQIVSTNDSERALDLARNKRPDLVLCDVDMPEMDGGDLSAAFYRDIELKSIPFLFLTALASPSDLKATRGEIGGRPAVSKHAPVQELTSRILQLLVN